MRAEIVEPIMREADRPSEPSDRRIAAGRSSKRSHLSPIIAAADRLLVRLKMYRPDSRPVTKMQSLLAAVAIATAGLFALNGAVEKWHRGGGSGSAAVDLIYWVVWIAYTLARIGLIGVLVATLYQWYRSRERSQPTV